MGREFSFLSTKATNTRHIRIEQWNQHKRVKSNDPQEIVTNHSTVKTKERWLMLYMSSISLNE